MSTPAPLTIADYRRPGKNQPLVSLRLPPDLLASLDSHADRLKTTRSGLCRTLLAQELEKLQESMGA
jgi:hypothetical protein